MAQVARFEEQCAQCNGDISPGDHVEYDSSAGGWVHEDSDTCEENRDSVLWSDDDYDLLDE